MLWCGPMLWTGTRHPVSHGRIGMALGIGYLSSLRSRARRHGAAVFVGVVTISGAQYSRTASVLANVATVMFLIVTPDAVGAQRLGGQPGVVRHVVIALQQRQHR